MSTIESIEISERTDVTNSLLDTKRQQVSDILRSGLGFLAIKGPCAALSSNSKLIAKEARASGILEAKIPGLVLIDRLPVWKPRSDPNAWSGDEATNSRGALALIEGRAAKSGNVSLEIGLMEHIERYTHLLALAWTGARSNDVQLKKRLVIEHPKLSVPIKNGLEGDIQKTLSEVDELNELRKPGDAPVVLLFRGGDNAQNPKAWEKEYIRAHELTGGRFIVDVAHGGEMAHDAEGKFQKTVEGEESCLDHVIGLSRQGLAPVGVMVEASDAPRVIDPHMPHQVALDKIQTLAQVVIDLQ